MVRSGKGEWNTAELFEMAKVVNPKMVRKEIRWSLMLHWMQFLFLKMKISGFSRRGFSLNMSGLLQLSA